MRWAADRLLHFSREIHLLHFNPEKSQGGRIPKAAACSWGSDIKCAKRQIIPVLEITFLWHTGKFAHIPMDFATASA